MLENRIISLSPNSATIFLGKNLGESSGLVKDRINLAINILNSTCRHGIINLEDLPSFVCEPLNNIIKTLEFLGFKYCPAEALVDGISISAQVSQSIKKSGAFVVMD